MSSCFLYRYLRGFNQKETSSEFKLDSLFKFLLRYPNMDVFHDDVSNFLPFSSENSDCFSLIDENGIRHL